MDLRMNHITVSNIELPIRMDNLVLQKIQDKYGSMIEFELKLMGWEKKDGKIVIVGDPSLSVINWILPEMVREGWEVEKKEACPYSANEINRMVDISYIQLSLIIHDEMMRAFDRKKKDLTKTGRMETKPKEMTGKSTFLRSIWSGLKSLGLRRRA